MPLCLAINQERERASRRRTRKFYGRKQHRLRLEKKEKEKASYGGMDGWMDLV